MSVFGLILVLTIFGLINLARATNYCDPNLCKFNNQVRPHIGCKNNGKFATNCINPSMITISPKIQQAILWTHNDLRNKVANGTLARFSSAKRMPTLSWETELEYLAGLNVHRCQLEHDKCRNTDAYKWSGQNLAIHYTTGSIKPDQYESIIVMLMNEWFNENKDANQADVDKCNAVSLQKQIGHFTAMIQEKTSKVGCGAATFTVNLKGKKWTTVLVACNYSFTNMLDFPIYTKGAKCSACQTGCNPQFNGLCSVTENVSPVPQ